MRGSGVCWLVVVEGVHDGGGDEGAGPYHCGGPDEKTAGYAGDSEAHYVGGEDEEDLETPFEVLVVEYLLCEEDVDCVAYCCSGGGHDSYHGVFFDVEGAGVEVDFVSEEGEGFVWHCFGPEASYSGDGLVWVKMDWLG